MVVPLSLLTDEGEREFFVEGRDRDVEAVYDFFRAVRVLHGILRRLEKRRAVLLRILRASREEAQDVLGSEAYMDLAIEFVKNNRPHEPKKARSKSAPVAEQTKNALED